MKKLREECWALIRKPWFIIPLCLTALVGYGYMAGHLSIGADDLQVPVYVQDLFALRTGRLWQWVLLSTVLSIPDAEYALAVLSVLAMLLAAALLCVWLKRAAEDQLRPACYPVFACIFISYPLIAEIWVYNSAMVAVSLGYVAVALALLAAGAFLERKTLPRALACAGLLWIAYSLYEPLSIAFILGVFACLGLRAVYGRPEEARLATMLKNGLWCALLLAAAVIVNTLAVAAVLGITGYELIQYAASQMGWLTEDGTLAEKLGDLIRTIVTKFGLFGFFYFPIGLMQICAAFTAVFGAAYAIRRKKPAILLPSAGMLVTMLLVPLLLCKEPEYRSCQELPLFCALAVTAALQWALTCWKRAWLKRVAAAGCGALCLAQSVYLSSQFRLDYRQHEDCVRVMAEVIGQVRQIGDSAQKPVIFLGDYSAGDQLTAKNSVHLENERLRSLFTDTQTWPIDVQFSDSFPQRYLTWMQFAFTQYGSPGDAEFYRYLEYLCYDVQRCTPEQFQAACRIAPGLPWYGQQDNTGGGKFTETEDCILVKLGSWFEEFV